MLVKFNFRIATSIILGCALWWKIVISCDSVNYLNHLRFMHKVLFWIIPRFSFFLQKNVANNFSGSSISSVMSVYPLKFIDFFFFFTKIQEVRIWLFLLCSKIDNDTLRSPCSKLLFLLSKCFEIFTQCTCQYRILLIFHRWWYGCVSIYLSWKQWQQVLKLKISKERNHIGGAMVGVLASRVQ